MALDDQQLFRRFCRDGDVQALGELFDRVAPALLRVALHLTRDPAAAEDLLQSTFLRAIEAREQWDGERPLLPWLCGILQNRARHDRWQAGRAPDPARLAPPPPLDPARAAECAEFDAAIDGAIAELPEIYRPVLRLHLAYGHQPAEIAHALERPPGTVRSQLARGLELLRKLLPAGFAGGAALCLSTGRGLAAVKQAVQGHAGVTMPAAVAGALIGGAAMTKKITAVVAVAVLVAGAWVAWPKTGVAPRRVTSDAPTSMSASTSVPAAAHPEPPPVSVRLPVAVPAGETTGSLRIQCRYGEDGSRAWGVAVTATPWGVPDGAMLRRTVQTGDDGSALVTNLPPGQTWVGTGRGGEPRSVEVGAGVTTDVELVISAGIDVHGRVVDQHGAPAPNAQVWLSAGLHDYTDGAFVATADQAGRLFLRSVEPERFLSATRAGLRSAVVQPVRGEVGSIAEIELALPGVGASLLGKVTGPRGAPATDARVFVGWREASLRWSPEQFSEHRPPLDLRTAADGTFAAHGLPPGSKQRVWVREAGTCVWYGIVQLEASGDTALAVELQTGAALAGRATDAEGEPVAGTWITYGSTTWLSSHKGPDWAFYGARTDAGGRYRIDCITPGTLRLLARKDALEVRGEVPVAAGETAAWDPVLTEIAIRGRVVDERGEPLAGVRVQALPPRGRGNMAGVKTDADGRFDCRTLAPVPYVLAFYAAGDAVGARPAAKLFGVEPGGDELLVRLPDAMIPTAAIVGRLLDTDGRAPGQARVYCSSEGLRFSPEADVDASTGAFRIGPLPAGVWRLQGSVGDGRDARRSGWCEAFALFAGETRDAGVIQMPIPGSIAVSVTGPDGAPLDGSTVVLEDSTGWSENPWQVGKLDRGKLCVDGVAPGSYRVRVGGDRNLPTVYEPVTVSAGQQTTVDIAVPKGVAVQLVLSPVSEPVPIHETFVWTRDGAWLQRYDNRLEGKAELVWQQRLLPGAYEITVTSETGKRATTRFQVAAGDPDGRAIAIDLP